MPGAKAAAACSALARLPLGMYPLALLMVVQQAHGSSYAAAGATVAAFTAAAALGGPVVGRLADRHGGAQVLVGSALVHAAALVAVAAQSGGPAGALAAAAVAGAATPPVGPVMRAVWAHLTQGPAVRQAAFGIEAVLTESAYLVGPTAVAAALAWSEPLAALLTAAVLALVGAICFATLRPIRITSARPGRLQPRRSGVLPTAGLRVLLTIEATVFAAFGLVDVGVAASSTAAGQPAAAGILLTVWSAGSLVGALSWGFLSRDTRHRRRLAMLCAAVGAALALLTVAPGLVLLGVGLFVAGLAIGPAGVVIQTLVAAVAPAGRRVEAYSWAATATMIGMAGGAFAGGWLVQQLHPATAFAAAGTLEVSAAGVALVSRTLATQAG